MNDGLSNLLGWASEFCGDSAQVNRLSAALLQPRAGGGRSKPLSVLNNDGSPLQLCITLGHQSRKLRIIGDPAAHIEDPELRFAHAQNAIEEVFDLTDTVSLAKICKETLQQMLPVNKNIEALRPGSMWLAAGLGGGAALYVNTRWGDVTQRWQDAERLLRELVPDGVAYSEMIKLISTHASIASVALEGRSARDARLKLYWRLNAPVSIDQMGVPLLSHPSFKAFLNTMVAERALSLSGLVFSAGFRLSDGKMHDVKMDLCAHCLPRQAAEWVQLLSDCCKATGLVPLDLADGLESGRCELAFVGFGIDRSDHRRMNIYLKAPSVRL